MKPALKLMSFVAFCLLFLLACSRDDDNNQPQNPQNTPGLTWRENDINGTVKSAGSAEFRNTYKSLFAFAGSTATSGTVFEINLNGVAPGTYDFSSGNAFYFNGFSSGNPVTGKLVLTSNTNGKASGTFEAFTTGGSITKVYGTFTDIPSN